MANSVNLANVIEKYQKSVKYISGTCEKEIFSNFYDKINRNFIHIWVNNTFNKTSVKCLQKSTNFRYKGNRNFLLSNFDEAIKNYTESLIFSPCNSENYAFALACRSAVFLIKKDYESCISDIEVCLEHDYPIKLKYKIYLRLIRSYLKLFLFNKASESINKLKFHLENEYKELSEAQMDKINSEISQIQTEMSEKPDLARNDTVLKSTLVKYHQNKNFISASNLISLQYSDLKGRHVTASQDIKMGEILFVEKPFSFVPVLLENPNVKTFCYHCFVPTVCPIPCKNCKTQFCCQKCFENSWDAYHRFECPGSCVELWPQIGVNYLAVRMLILGAKTGYKNVFNVTQNGVELFGNCCDNYDYVCSLVSNVEKMDKIDVFPHVVSAIIFTTYLIEKTNFADYVLENINNARVTPEKRENLPYIIGSVLLKHILQVISNAATIESVKDEFYELFNSTEHLNDNGHYFSGVGMYPSCSMMNHSCEPNISNYFINDAIIIKAKFDIKKGQEIYNSYGYDCRIQRTIDRKDELKKQHYFDCECTACTFPTKPEMLNRGLLCQNCNGLSLAKNNNIYNCVNCKREFNAKNHFLYIKKAETLFEKWQRTKNIEHLIKCLELREKVFYKYNFCIYSTKLELLAFYEEKGDMQIWWEQTQKTLELDSQILGENSLRSGMNLRYILLTLLTYLKSLSLEKKNNIPQLILIDMIDKVKIMFEKMKKIFILYYNEASINFQEIHELIEDAEAIVTYILGEKLYINTLEEALNELCVDNLQ